MDDLDDSAKLTLQVADEEQGKRLDHLLAKHFPDISRSRIKALIVDGKVTVDGVVSKAPALRVKTVGAAVEMHVPPTVSVDLLPQDLPLDILYEDEHLIIINKAAGMVVHPRTGAPGWHAGQRPVASLRRNPVGYRWRTASGYCASAG